MTILQLRNVSKSYTNAGGTLHVLRDVNLEVGEGEFVALLDFLAPFDRAFAGGAAGAVGAGDERGAIRREVGERLPQRVVAVGRLGREDFDRQPEAAAGVDVADAHEGPVSKVSRHSEVTGALDPREYRIR